MVVQCRLEHRHRLVETLVLRHGKTLGRHLVRLLLFDWIILGPSIGPVLPFKMISSELLSLWGYFLLFIKHVVE